MWSEMSPVDGLVSFDGNARTFHPSPLLSITFTPVQWALMLEEDPWGTGVYTVFMVVDAHPLSIGGLEGLPGQQGLGQGNAQRGFHLGIVGVPLPGVTAKLIPDEDDPNRCEHATSPPGRSATACRNNTTVGGRIPCFRPQPRENWKFAPQRQRNTTLSPLLTTA